MSRKRIYLLGFGVPMIAAVVMGVAFNDTREDWQLYLTMVAYGIGIYFQGRWHELEVHES